MNDTAPRREWHPEMPGEYTDGSPTWIGRDTEWPYLNLKCPECGFDYVAVRSAGAGMGWSADSTGHFLEMAGECGHCFTVEFTFHKGQTFVDVHRDVARERLIDLEQSLGDRS